MLTRWFGRRVASSLTVEPPRIIELAPDIAAIDLLTDLVVRSGELALIGSTRNTIRVGDMQLRVRAGGKLTIEGLTLAQSVVSPALEVQGTARVIRSIIQDCSTSMNILWSSGLQSCGGAVIATNGGTIELLSSDMVNNTVKGSGYAHGGAMCVIGGSLARLAAARLLQNAASGAQEEHGQSGGAIYLLNSTAEVLMYLGYAHACAHAHISGAWLRDLGQCREGRPVIVRRRNLCDVQLELEAEQRCCAGQCCGGCG